jgi:predicted DNA-binding mobile mystery protein A
MTRLEQIKKLDEKLKKFKTAGEVHKPPKGWIRAIRSVLGMTTAQMALKVGISQPRVIHIEQSESIGEIKISTLQKIAGVLEMDFVYGFIPRRSLEEIVKEQAIKIAKDRMSVVGHTMALEEQDVSQEEKKRMVERIVEDILEKLPKKFWTE